MKRLFALAALAALLAGCAGVPPTTATASLQRWDGGVWNSVLGYHGPANAMAGAGGPSGGPDGGGAR